MIGIYFSGSGNTAYCVRQFLKVYDCDSEMVSIEDDQVLSVLSKHTDILLAYPIYYSALPKIMKDFLEEHLSAFQGKNVFLLATMGLFSGDGCGCAARLLKPAGAKILGGLHIKMPDCIADEKALKRSIEKDKELIHAADQKIKQAVEAFQKGTPPQDGLGFLCHMAGLFGQRLWFYHKTTSYSDKLRIDTKTCIGCGICADQCPMRNLSIINHKALSKGQCTMCYRCVNACPVQAITLLGKKITKQHHLQDLIDKQKSS